MGGDDSLAIVEQHVNDVTDDNDPEAESLSVPSVSLKHELEGDLLQGVVHDSILDDGAEEFGNLL